LQTKNSNPFKEAEVYNKKFTTTAAMRIEKVAI